MNHIHTPRLRGAALFALAAVAWLLSALPGGAQSTINPAVPAQGGPLTSATVRNNFLAAYNDINTLYSAVNGIFSGNHNFTGSIGFLGATTAVTQASSDNSTLLATTAFVQSVAAAGAITAGTTVCNSCVAGGVLYGNVNVQSSAVVFPVAAGLSFQFNSIPYTALQFPTSETTAGASIAIGPFALGGQTVSGAYQNIGIGYQVMTSTMTTAAAQNNVIGYQSFIFNSSGNDNNVLGSAALQHNTSGQHNMVFGGGAAGANTSGNGNIAIGASTMAASTTASFNICIGFATCSGPMTVDGQNVVVGFESAGALTTGASNVVMGSTAFSAATTAIGNIAIGQNALQTVTTSNDGVNCFSGLCSSIAIGNMSMQNFVSGLRNTAVGHDSFQAFHSGDYNTAFGFEAGLYLTGELGGDCVAPTGVSGAPFATGDCVGNTAVGGVANTYMTGGNFNTGVGYYVMFGNNRADSPTFTANYAGQNTGVGAYVLGSLTNGMSNIGVGYNALRVVTGVTVAVARAVPNAVGSGYGTSVSGTMTWSGAGCTTDPVLNVITTAGGAISTVSSIATAGVCATVPSSSATTWTAGGSLSAGSGASFTMGFTGGGDGSDNVAVGRNAGAALTVGSLNTLLGALSGANLTTGLSNIIIGNVNASSATVSNSLNLANIMTGTGASGTAASTTASFPGTTAATSPTAAAVMMAGGLGVSGALYTGAYYEIPASSSTTVGVIRQAGSVILSTYNGNFFLGITSGNFTTTGSGGNMGLGNGAFNALTTGIQNTTTGYGNMPKLTTGNYNTSMGFNSMVVLTTGSQNSCFGWQCMSAAITAGNIAAFGFNTAADITTGTNDSCFGFNSCAGLTTGSSNTMVGNFTTSGSTVTSANSTTSTSSTTLTLGGNDTTTAWLAGVRLQGACIAPGTTIASVTDSTHVVMTQNGATNSSTCVVSAFSSPVISYTATTTSNPTFSGTTMTLAGSDTVASLGILSGVRVTAAGITASTVIASCSSSTSCTTNTSNSLTGVSATFNNPIGGPGLLTGSNNVIIGRLNVGTLSSPNATGVITIADGGAVLRMDWNNTNSAAWTITGKVFATGLTTATAAQTSYACIASTNQIIAVAVANTCATSSAKFKEDISDLVVGLDDLVRLRPVAYRYKATGNDKFDNAPGQRDIQMGFIAEEAAAINPLFVTKDEDGNPRTVRYEQLTAGIVNALKELKADNDNLRAEVGRLRAAGRH